jgi:hypothetical protein
MPKDENGGERVGLGVIEKNIENLDFIQKLIFLSNFTKRLNLLGFALTLRHLASPLGLHKNYLIYPKT